MQGGGCCSQSMIEEVLERITDSLNTGGAITGSGCPSFVRPSSA